MNFSFTNPWVLFLSVLAVIPLLRANQEQLAYSSLAILPQDKLSVLVDWFNRLTGSALSLILICGLAGPKLDEYLVEHIGTGAHIVLLLDRSASMNANFAGSYLGGGSKESKISMARQLLNDFVKRKQNNLFGMLSFSTSPVYTVPLTQDRVAVSAAIRGTTTGGQGLTNIAPGLSMALDFFKNKPVTGSRVILLVSDGAAVLEPETQEILRQRFNENRAVLYWIYLRTQNSSSLKAKPKNPNERTSPEYFLHRFFQTLDTPYRAFEAENPTALKQAIHEIEQMENQPMHYFEKTAQRDLSQYVYATALVLVIVLLTIKTMEIRTWK